MSVTAKRGWTNFLVPTQRFYWHRWCGHVELSYIHEYPAGKSSGWFTMREGSDVDLIGPAGAVYGAHSVKELNVTGKHWFYPVAAPRPDKWNKYPVQSDKVSYHWIENKLKSGICILDGYSSNTEIVWSDGGGDSGNQILDWKDVRWQLISNPRGV